jgi:hypothetical protein
MPIRFAYRGAVSWGEFFISDNFVLGDAYYEAYSNSERAEAAVIWLTPSAMEFHRQVPHDNLLSSSLLYWEVPLKKSDGGHDRYQTLAVNPLVPGEGEPSPSMIQELILATFVGSNEPGVAQKKVFTREFLDVARRHAERNEV